MGTVFGTCLLLGMIWHAVEWVIHFTTDLFS